MGEELSTQGHPSGGTTPQVMEPAQELRRVPLFSEVAPALLEEAVAKSSLRIEPSGTVLCREGEYGNTIFVILEGSVEVGMGTAAQDYMMLALLRAGEVFGEMAVLSGNPRSATVIAQERVTLLEMPHLLLQELMKKSAEFKRALENIQAEHTVANVLKRSPLLSDVEEPTLQQITDKVKFRAFKKGEVVFREGDMGDSLYVIRSGFVKVTKRYGDKERILGYHTAGSFFGEMALLESDSRTATVSAFTSVEAVQIMREEFLELWQHYPSLKETVLRAARERRQATAELEQDPSKAEVFEELVNKGIIQAGNLLVIDLNVCIGCDNCIRACNSRHGEPRLDRHGTRIASVNIPVACRLCQDPLCLLCPYDGIRRASTGEIYITDKCIGCTGCVRRCPYDVIRMRELEPEAMEETEDEGFWVRLFSRGSARKPVTPPPEVEGKAVEKKAKITRRAVKCNHCLGYQNQACVQNCPVHAIQWVNPLEFFKNPEDILRASPLKG